MKPLKTTRLIFGIFLAVGMVLLAVAVVSYWHTRQFRQNAASADGVVIENVWSSRTYFPQVRFRTSGGQDLTFTSNMGSKPASYQVGDRVRVLYDPEKPADASIDSFESQWLLPTIFGSLGLIFCSVGIAPFAWQRHVRRRNEWLRANGRRIQADFDRVELNTSLRVNGSSPYRIVCQWRDPATNQVHVFHSRNIWYDPQKYIMGTTMEVIVDPDNFKRYMLETGYLPELAE